MVPSEVCLVLYVFLNQFKSSFLQCTGTNASEQAPCWHEESSRSLGVKRHLHAVRFVSFEPPKYIHQHPFLFRALIYGSACAS